MRKGGREAGRRRYRGAGHQCGSESPVTGSVRHGLMPPVLAPAREVKPVAGSLARFWGGRSDTHGWSVGAGRSAGTRPKARPNRIENPPANANNSRTQNSDKHLSVAMQQPISAKACASTPYVSNHPSLAGVPRKPELRLYFRGTTKESRDTLWHICIKNTVCTDEDAGRRAQAKCLCAEAI